MSSPPVESMQTHILRDRGPLTPGTVPADGVDERLRHRQRPPLTVPGTTADPAQRARPLFFRTKIGFLLCLMVALAIAALIYFYGIVSVVPHYVVARGSVVVEITGPGILDATNKVTVTSRIPGFLKTILVDRNDPVTAGQSIAQLDAGDVQYQLEAARADAEAAKSAILEARSNQAKGMALLDKAKSDVARRRQLPAGIVSAVEIEALEITVRQAQAEYDRLTALIDRSLAQARGAMAQVQVLEFKRAEAEIRSPLNGVVVSRDRSVGDLLVAGMQLFQLVDPTSIIVSTRLDELIMGLIEPGQTTRLRFTSSSLRAFDAKVLRVSRNVDPETREFIVEVTPEELPRNWALGQRANVAIKVPLPSDTIAVPQAFVAHRGGRAGVWRQEQGRAVWAPIDVGAVSGTYLQVLGGLSAGDAIVHPKGRYMFERVSTEGLRE